MINKKIVRIWWAWQWRIFIALILANVAFAAILIPIDLILGLSQESLTIITNLFSVGAGIYASIYFLGYVLTLDYGDFRIVIFEEEEDPYRRAVRK
ncbi:MAG: hypothetical protein GXO19_01800 [Epsilonproteobacteria bacterium]|nr:hypothetical protein [Campylobacterota bacterium]NPA56450.1 hypothetical protein [Campylobacterota bacterium]